MRVIYIGVPNECSKFGDAPELKVHNDYTVINTELINNRYYYELSGFPGWGYYVAGFIPLSTIDETELLYNRQTELA